MNYYHDLITQKSWQVLQNLKRKYQFILIGDWAVFLYSQALKSKDIDLVVDFEELEKLRKEFEVAKNNRLRKYQVRVEEVEVDIYLPFYSNPGLPAEDLNKYTTVVEGFVVPKKEVLVVLKMKAVKGRQASPKGRKDLIDIISLFRLPDFNWQSFKSLIVRYRLEDYLNLTKNKISATSSISELGLNVHKMARFKRKVLSQI